jgi:hypothetical protein
VATHPWQPRMGARCPEEEVDGPSSALPRPGRFSHSRRMARHQVLGHDASSSFSAPQTVAPFLRRSRNSLPWIEAARSDARNATRSATSSGRPGLHSGILRASPSGFSGPFPSSVPACSARRPMRQCAAVVSMKPGAIVFARTPFGRHPWTAPYCRSSMQPSQPRRRALPRTAVSVVGSTRRG